MEDYIKRETVIAFLENMAASRYLIQCFQDKEKFPAENTEVKTIINKIIAHINDDIEEVKDCAEDTDPIGYGIRLGLMASRAYIEVIRDNERS